MEYRDAFLKTRLPRVIGPWRRRRAIPVLLIPLLLGSNCLPPKDVATVTSPATSVCPAVTKKVRTQTVIVPVASTRQIRRSKDVAAGPTCNVSPRTFFWVSDPTAGKLRIASYGDRCGALDDSNALMVLDLTNALKLVRDAGTKLDSSCRVVAASALFTVEGTRTNLDLAAGETPVCVGQALLATNDGWSTTPIHDFWDNVPQFGNATFDLLDPAVPRLPMHLPPRSGEPEIPVSPPALPGWNVTPAQLEIDLTSAMQSWLDRGVANNGIVFKPHPAPATVSHAGCVSDLNPQLIGVTIDIDP